MTEQNKESVGDQVGDVLDAVSGVSSNPKVKVFAQIGSFLSRFIQSLVSKKK